MTREDRIALLRDVDLYPVTCQDLSDGRTDLEVLDGVLAGGARMIQLREKYWDKKDLYELAVEFRKKTLEHNVLLIINDHVDVALAVDADGVHLGQEDLPIPAARSIAPELILGASSHNLEEALRAQEEGADYVNIGPIFPTKTKDKITRFIGPDAVREISPHLHIPFTTMGGINLDNIREVLEAGARRIAMVTGVTRAEDIAERVRALRGVILSYD
ncbi:MAG: thiamine phosphate synthase [Deltaproteobacteria bacterium]|nr:thiamine phosphate synthase [Deltaproteobacteria bacterium]